MHNKWQTIIILLTLLTTFLAIWFLRPGGSIQNVAAVQTSGNLGAYWDSGCSSKVTTIDWGNMTPCQTKNITFYVRNEGSTTIFLSAIDKNWIPTTADSHIHFFFDSEDQKLQANAVKKVNFGLTVTPETTNITNYSFEMLLQGTDYLLADVNQDGKVDFRDIALVISLFNTTPTSSNWNPNADLNRDFKVNMLDVALVCQDFAKTAS